MRKQTEITKAGSLLDQSGVLVQRGYAVSPLLYYRRSDIKAPPWRIKEWDFYQVSNDDYCVQFTIGHTAYAGTLTVTFFRFRTECVTTGRQRLFCLLAPYICRKHLLRA